MEIGNYQVALEAIKVASSIIIFHHIRPDGDCLGSQAGLAELIKINFPTKKVFIIGDSGNVFNFMNYQFQDQKQIDWKNSLAIVVDASSGDRIEQGHLLYENKATKKLRIDHHPNGSDIVYDYEWIDSSYVAAAEMIAFLAKAANWKVSQKAASHIYLGINTDSGRFLYEKTSSRTYALVAFLMEISQFHPNSILKQMSQRNLKDLEYSGYILSNFQKQGRVLYLPITQSIMQKLEIDSLRAAISVNEIANIEDNSIWAFFIELEDKTIRVRLRSNGPLVNKVAMQYNGGGHANASGCTLQSWDQMPIILDDLNAEIMRWEKIQ